MIKAVVISSCLMSSCLWAQDFLKGNVGNANGNALFQEKRYEEALNAYLDAYGQDTDNGVLAYNIANTYLALGDMGKARQFFDRALTSQHDVARQNACFNLSYLQLQEDDLQDAIANLVAYLKSDPEDIDAKRNLEVALRRLEQQQKQSQGDPQDESNRPRSPDQNASSAADGSTGESEDGGSQNNRSQDGGAAGDQTEPSEGSPEHQQRETRKPESSKMDGMDESMKRQILNALEQQEAKQQREYQRRKIGRVKRHAKDW